jgi:hypothetical protein
MIRAALDAPALCISLLCLLSLIGVVLSNPQTLPNLLP